MAQTIPSGEVTAALLQDVPLFDRQNTRLGTIEDVIGEGERAVLHVSAGGMFGIGGRRLVHPVSRVEFLREDNGRLLARSALSAAEFAGLPEA